MPKRTDIESVLILGAGPIIIGQACEFDYSGAQACKALREEGYRVILVNSNPATIMTDPSMADATYIEPIEWQTVARIIEIEKPDVLLPTMGGQTALNCALDLAREGVLEKHGVEMIGATKEAIDTVMKLGMAHPMGPLTLADFIGLDICLDIMEVLYEGFGDSKYRPCPLLRRMVDAGHLGRKSGLGFYDYS